MPAWLLFSVLATAAPEADLVGPVPSRPVALAAGPGHTCALRADGAVACWGGLTAAGFRAGEEPSTLVPRVVGDLANVRSLAAGGPAVTCAVRADEAAFCWGLDEAPRPIEGLRAASVAVGQGHACATDPEGAVWCWGANSHGQLGDGGTERRATAARVPGVDDAVAVAAGFYHACALRRTGEVWCWGHDGHGQLGDGAAGGPALSPAPVVGLSDAAALAAGAFHTCALRRGGGVVCWGSNNSGQLGDGTATSRATPGAVHGIDDATAIAVGMEHACALRASGDLSCWGGNDQGQLGNPRTVDHLFPTPVRGLGPVTGVAAGQEHTCAIAHDGAIACWGRNSTGQLGDGTRESRAEPRAVATR